MLCTCVVIFRCCCFTTACDILFVVINVDYRDIDVYIHIHIYIYIYIYITHTVLYYITYTMIYYNTLHLCCYKRLHRIVMIIVIVIVMVIVMVIVKYIVIVIAIVTSIYDRLRQVQDAAARLRGDRDQGVGAGTHLDVYTCIYM